MQNPAVEKDGCEEAPPLALRFWTVLIRVPVKAWLRAHLSDLRQIFGSKLNKLRVGWTEEGIVLCISVHGYLWLVTSALPTFIEDNFLPFALRIT